MSDKKRHLNPLLLLIAILLCLSAGFLFRRTSFDPNYKIPARHSSVIKKSKVTPTPVLTQKPKANVSISATPTITVEPSVSPSESISQDETSPEASLGVWTSSGSNWMFMVDGVPYTGWLIDTDGKQCPELLQIEIQQFQTLLQRVLQMSPQQKCNHLYSFRFFLCQLQHLLLQ